MSRRDHVATLKSLIREPYAWPGGYTRYAVTSDGAALCAACCRAEYRIILASTRTDARDGWTVAGAGSECDTDGPLECDHCNGTIIEETV